MWVCWMAAAWGGGVFINDVQVDPASIAGKSLTHVTVRFDPEGNVRIDAPGYEVRLTDPAASPAPTDSLVPQGRYWLVTEDDGTVGHTIEVSINGQLAVTVTSAEPQRVVDLARWLQPGENAVSVKGTSQQPKGGNLYVYIGSGQTDPAGTMVMGEPAVEFGLGASREGVTEREFSFVVE